MFTYELAIDDCSIKSLFASVKGHHRPKKKKKTAEDFVSPKTHCLLEVVNLELKVFDTSLPPKKVVSVNQQEK